MNFKLPGDNKQQKLNNSMYSLAGARIIINVAASFGSTCKYHNTADVCTSNQGTLCKFLVDQITFPSLNHGKTDIFVNSDLK